MDDVMINCAVEFLNITNLPYLGLLDHHDSQSNILREMNVIIYNPWPQFVHVTQLDSCLLIRILY
jgi:hypothetical protein